jgi:hypothetical protein
MSLLNAHTLINRAISTRTDQFQRCLAEAIRPETIEDAHTLTRLDEALKNDGVECTAGVSFDPFPRYNLWAHKSQWEAIKATSLRFGLEAHDHIGIKPYLQRETPGLTINIFWIEEH